MKFKEIDRWKVMTSVLCLVHELRISMIELFSFSRMSFHPYMLSLHISSVWLPDFSLILVIKERVRDALVVRVCYINDRYNERWCSLVFKDDNIYVVCEAVGDGNHVMHDSWREMEMNVTQWQCVAERKKSCVTSSLHPCVIKGGCCC